MTSKTKRKQAPSPGGSKDPNPTSRKAPKATSGKGSSAASTDPLANSPPSVTRNPLRQPTQQPQSSAHVLNVPQQSQLFNDNHSPLIAPTPRSLASSQSQPQSQQQSQQSQQQAQQRSMQVQPIARANSTTRVQPLVNDDEEEEDADDQQAFGGGEQEAGEEERYADYSSDDGASSDEDEAANEGLYITLSALLTAPGRDGNIQRLSPHIEEGSTW